MINLYNCDNMEFMKNVPDKFYNLAIVDPPYGIKRDGHKGVEAKNKKHNWKKYEFKGWDIERPSKLYWKELFRVSKNQIVFGANYFTKYLPPSMGWIFWDKGQDLTMSDGELAFTSFNKALRRKIMNRCQLVVEGNLLHPTQKPVQLYKWLLTNYAKQGDKILDTHGGSMSIALACHDLGFDLDLCELDKDYFNAGIKRFEQHKKQLKLL